MNNYSFLEAVYNEYVDDLYHYGISLGFDSDVVMDAIHDVFLNLFSKNDSLEVIQNKKFYLIRSLKNNLINASKYINRTVNLTIQNDSVDNTSNAEDVLIREEIDESINRKITTLLNALTDKQREIIYLRYILEYDYDEIAAVLSITKGACRKLVSKAMQKLREDQL